MGGIGSPVVVAGAVLTFARREDGVVAVPSQSVSIDPVKTNFRVLTQTPVSGGSETSLRV